MRSANALTCLATLGAISSVSAGPFSWLHIRDDAPVATTESTTADAATDVDASLTVDGKNASLAELYAYLNGTSFNASSWLNSTANATHAITFDADAEAEAEEIELELSYLDGEAVLSFLNGTQLCKGDASCREIVGEELGLTTDEIADAEECAEELEEEEEECDEEEDDDEEEEDEDCDDGEWEGEDETSAAPASTTPVANNWNVAASSSVAPTTRSNVYHVAAATNVPSASENVPTSTATSYMYVTSGAPAGATGTPFPSASGVSGSEQGDDSTVTVTQYVTITVDRIIISVSGAPEAATTILSTATPAVATGAPGNNFHVEDGSDSGASSALAGASSAVAGATSTGASSPAATGSYDSPDSPDTPDSEDSADDGYGNVEDCEEDEIPEEEDDEEWECDEEEIEGDDATPEFAEYYNATECQAILALNATEVNATFAELTAWCANATAVGVPLSQTAAEDVATASETWSSVDATSTETWSSVAATSTVDVATATTEWSEAMSTESASSSQSESGQAETASESESMEPITSYVDVYATEYVQPSASSTSAEAVETAQGETLSKRLANGFRRVRRSHVGRNAFV